MAHRFGDLEAVVMERVWAAEDDLTVRDVYESLLFERELAYTTVMSTMDNLHRKGWLDRERHGKAYLYWPTLTREEYSAQLMRDALEGTRSDLVLAHFVKQISEDESEALRALLRRVKPNRPQS
ncbi:BlaI/MecI/CopY family transcriptional regulator [Nocardia farcinica]|uniref:BlaI/MecI/CopY family transcriptional regulator n=1 Tax=Nocardia TaxID=1817 RepID=UPI001893529E|nr:MULTISPECIES: BlaI/MecI/CopY family transcriptional regulator [Nocardia]MBF6289964.1 BlaI/MecI/CopY family transcriptional regulator [Nocardia cyriacigeorgica]MBF6422251.1 BlaI/MecI/CopY family transcriptional regulator [Nocardia farcinica]MBF6433907.1 BlaI/MecI/CopY family transcriptional regulator [Nocardia farcinica]MBF6504975.1 BlaI/MecI/CopY family transcriptional regulator [Nocardia farcinica]